MFLFLFCRTSCVINCEETVSVSTRLALQTSCAGYACETARYKWILISLDSLGNETNKGLKPDMTLTGLNLPGIIIKENELAGNLTYRLKVIATQDVGPEGIAAYQFTMNAPPVGGNCTVKPPRGRALNTSFDFQCSDWQVRSGSGNCRFRRNISCFKHCFCHGPTIETKQPNKALVGALTAADDNGIFVTSCYI